MNIRERERERERNLTSERKCLNIEILKNFCIENDCIQQIEGLVFCLLNANDYI